MLNKVAQDHLGIGDGSQTGNRLSRTYLAFAHRCDCFGVLFDEMFCSWGFPYFFCFAFSSSVLEAENLHKVMKRNATNSKNMEQNGTKWNNHVLKEEHLRISWNIFNDVSWCFCPSVSVSHLPSCTPILSSDRISSGSYPRSAEKSRLCHLNQSIEIELWATQPTAYHPICTICNSVELSPSWEAASGDVSLLELRSLWNSPEFRRLNVFTKQNSTRRPLLGSGSNDWKQ